MVAVKVEVISGAHGAVAGNRYGIFNMVIQPEDTMDLVMAQGMITPANRVRELLEIRFKSKVVSVSTARSATAADDYHLYQR